MSILPHIDGAERAMPRRLRLAWVEESFGFESPSGRQPSIPGERVHMGMSVSLSRLRLAAWTLAAVTCLLAGRLIFLQGVRGAHFRAAAEGNRERIIPIPAERGIVFDRRGAALTKNIPNFSLVLLPYALPRSEIERRAVVDRLAAITGRPSEDILRIIEEYRTYRFESLVIQEHLEYETALAVYVAAADVPGVGIQRGSRRLYVSGDSATTTRSLSHILGYEGKMGREELDVLYPEGYVPSDLIGKTGIEKTYERYLRGMYGKRRIEVNAIGRRQQVLAETPPVPGGHVILTIDAEMQRVLEGFLSSALRSSKQRRAAGIVMDPRNGDILTLVSLPAFDNNDFAGGIDEQMFAVYTEDPWRPLFHRAISGTYPSGSTIKPAIAAAALHEGIITPKTSVHSAGGVQVGPWFFPDWKAGGHGATDVRKSLAESVNTFYYYVGGGYRSFTGLGVERITEYLKRFGFASLLGVDLPGEASGFLPSKSWKLEEKQEPWYIGDTYNLSIGQGDLLVTPLQIAAMTGVIANGGTLYRPRVVQALANAVTKERQEVPPTPLRTDVVRGDVIETVQLGMRDCVLGGSCRRLADLPIAIAGKTGTAQWRQDRPTHAWFTSFAPWDAPEIVVTILIEEGGEGSAVAAPVAEQFYRWWHTHR